jgi:hypothetical protein
VVCREGHRESVKVLLDRGDATVLLCVRNSENLSAIHVRGLFVCLFLSVCLSLWIVESITGGLAVLFFLFPSVSRSTHALQVAAPSCLALLHRRGSRALLSAVQQRDAPVISQVVLSGVPSDIPLKRCLPDYSQRVVCVCLHDMRKIELLTLRERETQEVQRDTSD